jgi:hypothetical protein
MAQKCTTSSNDWAGRWLTLALIWWLPTLAIIIALFLPPSVRTAIWTVSFLWMGIACVLNAHRCGRLHCYFTGPLFLAGAAASLLHGLGILSLGPRGWAWIGYTLLFGSVLLNYLPEWIWGRYSTSLSK